MALKILLMIPILLSLVMISVSPAAADSIQNFGNTLTVGDFCGVDITIDEVNYGSLIRDEISDVQTVNISGTGNTDVNVFTHATNWTVPGETAIIIPGNYTTFAWINDADFGNNISLNKTVDRIDMSKTITYQTDIDSYWQVEVHLGNANDGFSGVLKQAITVEGECVQP